MPETILVTGGAGYIGSHIAVELATSGYAVVLLIWFVALYFWWKRTVAQILPRVCWRKFHRRFRRPFPLAFLILASVLLFFLRLRRVVKTVRGSRPTPDYNLFPLWPRIRNFLAEVVGQAKVMRQRPLPGVAHAFVFWGFCAMIGALLLIPLWNARGRRT